MKKIFAVTMLVLALAGCSSSPQKSLSLKATAHSVTLAWTQGTVASGSPAITGNNVYRGTTSGAETMLISLTSPAATYVDGTVAAGTTYFYEVTAVNSVGESAKSNEASATVPVATTAPNPPTGLTGTAQ
jgi:cellulose 1,4-beta-cellobiosidase